MIVNTFSEASPIVKAEALAGKRIGYVCVQGYLHDGHIHMVQELKKICDYAVVSAAYCSGDRYDPEYTILSNWGIDPNLPHPRKLMTDAMFATLDANVDLVIKETKPIPTPEEMPAYLAFCQQYYEPGRRAYDPDFLNRQNLNFPDYEKAGDALNCGNFIAHKVIVDKFFPIHVRINSWKEGLRRFVEAQLYQSLIGIEVVLIDPIRDPSGVMYSGSLLESIRNQIVALYSAGPLIRAYNDTKSELLRRLRDLQNWQVLKFEKYSGPLLAAYGANSVYYYVQVMPPVTNNSRIGELYSDAFLFKRP